MTLSAENYVSQTSAASARFNFSIWAHVVLLVFVWASLIVVAPLLKANAVVAANSLYTFFSYLCHQQSERSFYLAGEPLAVCARCAGVYLGLALGALIYPLVRSLNNLEPLPRIWLMLAPLPTTVDFLLGWFGIWENTHLSRFLTAAILGVACAFFLIPGAIEISRHFFSQQLTVNVKTEK